MSDESNPQAVVDETKAPAQPGAAGPDARDEGDDLDKLLAEYGESQKSPPAQPEPKAGTGDLQALLEPIKGELNEYRQHRFRQDMDKTLHSVRGDLDSAYFDDTFVESWIDAEARKNPGLGQAWANRHAEPKKFEKVVDALGRSFAKKYGTLPDRSATADRAAVTAAVRGASTKVPEVRPPDFTGMNNNEYREEHKKLYGYYPNI